MTSTALAHFIVSLGSLNDYSSSAYQTQLALIEQDTRPLAQNNEDVAIFNNAVAGVHAANDTGFSATGIVAINAAFTTPAPGEPQWPGHLRDARHYSADKTAILLRAHSTAAYYPPAQVSMADLTKIVTTYQRSPQNEAAAWQVFASVAKLQPFQDGNKRTALIAANAAFGGMVHDDYLLLPLAEMDRIEFMVTLMRYYQANGQAAEMRAFHQLLALLPSPTNRRAVLASPITEPPAVPHQAMQIKTQFKERH